MAASFGTPNAKAARRAAYAAKRPPAAACPRAASDLLADELVILAMRPDPKPMYAARHGEAKCAVIEADPNAMKSTICNRLEMQR